MTGPSTSVATGRFAFPRSNSYFLGRQLGEAATIVLSHAFQRLGLRQGAPVKANLNPQPVLTPPVGEGATPPTEAASGAAATRRARVGAGESSGPPPLASSNARDPASAAVARQASFAAPAAARDVPVAVRDVPVAVPDVPDAPAAVAPAARANNSVTFNLTRNTVREIPRDNNGRSVPPIGGAAPLPPERPWGENQPGNDVNPQPPRRPGNDTNPRPPNRSRD